MKQPTISAPAPETTIFQHYASALNTPAGGVLGACLFLLLVSALLQHQGRSKLTSARWVNWWERRNARRKATQQLQERKHNKVALYIGQPQYPGDPRPLYLPDCQRSMAVVGAPGSGKTFSVIDPCVRSALDQGFPMILFDAKYPTQASRHAAYAQAQGYEVHVFAPGLPESSICNLLDFLKDEEDRETAKELAMVLHSNFQRTLQGSIHSGDPFWTQSGQGLLAAAFTLAKASRYPDLLMVQKILATPNLGYRADQDAPRMNPWVRLGFDQVVSVRESDKTVASIVGTANGLMNELMQKGLLNAFVGQTNLPIHLTGKQLIVLGLDRRREAVISPLLATVLHLLVTKNMAKHRSVPLICALDELPVLYLSGLVNWVNKFREGGFVGILGYQHLAQLRATYGRENAEAIFSACATKALFNPGGLETAEMLSRYLGNKTVTELQLSRQSGGSSSRVSRTQIKRVRPLIEASELLQLPPGKAVIVNPAQGSARRAGVPMLKKIHVPKTDLKKQALSESLWTKKILPMLIKQHHHPAPTMEEMQARVEEAKRLLPKSQKEPPSYEQEG